MESLSWLLLFTSSEADFHSYRTSHHDFLSFAVMLGLPLREWNWCIVLSVVIILAEGKRILLDD